MLIDPYRFGDPFFGSTDLLLTGDTGEIVEWSGSTTIEVVGGCAISTEQIKFGSASIKNPDSDFPTSETDGVIVKDSVNTDRWAFLGEFTLEGWFFPIDITTGEDTCILISSGANFGPARFAIEVLTSTDVGRLRFRREGTVICESAVGVLVVGAWQHVAVARDSLDVIHIFLDGEEVASGTYSGLLGGVDEFGDAKLNIAIGVAGQVGDFQSYFDQIRVTEGVCRYSSNFTPPTEPFPKS